ncbi:MAG: DUF4302 domain-containing protein [Prevotellaceae bacterium]|jgi:hypothetical protein|nr:DUF4302 domain-containing protein [Prevotellaceae bacterium]
MKNKLLLIVLLAFAALQACVKDQEKVFDASAAERTNEAVNTLRDILVAEPNGWLVEYYPETDRSMGGYYFIWKFNANGTVVVAGEQATVNYPVGDTVRSCYDVIANRGVVLTFNTYNEVFHYFSEPHSTKDVDGYAGDYEFVIREVTPGQIVMTGKKYGNRIVLTPYTGGGESTWKSYLEQFKKLEKKFNAPVYLVKVDGAVAAIKRVTRKNRTFQFEYEKAEDNTIVPYIITATGIKLYEPLTVNGKTAQYFTFNEVEEELVSEDPENNIAIKMNWVSLSEAFATTVTQWFFGSPKQSPPQSGMCAPLADAIRTANTYINSIEGENIFFMYIGKGTSPTYEEHSIYFGCSSNGNGYYEAIYAFNFLNVAGADNQVRLEYTEPKGNGAYSTYLAAFTPVINLINNNSPYQLTSANVKNPTDLTFTSVKDKNFYFVVTL